MTFPGIDHWVPLIGDVEHHFEISFQVHSPCEDVELEDGDEVVTGEVDGRFERHGLEWRTDAVYLAQLFLEQPPRHHRSEIQ